jgi:SAM-dependent methyltransferase
MAGERTFDDLLGEAERQAFVGWDFTWLAERRRVQPPPWDFAALVADRARRSRHLLDLGTGGGEWLSRLPYQPVLTVATEAWAPNVPIAAKRLRPLGISVIQVHGARDNADQGGVESSGRLPFLSASFALVSTRHEAFVAAEVARVLVAGGRFLTQQVGHGDADDFYDLLGLPRPPVLSRTWTLSLATTQVEDAGLEVLASGESEEQTDFLDVGAFAWYLKAISWTVPAFSIASFRPRLAELHDRLRTVGPLVVRQPRFWLEARRPA